MDTQEKRRGRPFGRSEATLRSMQGIIEFVKQYHKDNRFAPTLKEIALGIGKKEQDFGNVHQLVQQLIDEGFLVNAGRHQGRSITLAAKPPRRWYHKSE